MSPLTSIVLGTLCGLCAVGARLAAPAAPAYEDTDALPPAPQAALTQTIALGRNSAAADVAWLRSVFFIGSPHSEQIKYEGLAPWINLINDLDPHFELPYFVGGILVSTNPKNGPAADAILAKGEEINPNSFEYPMWRGFIHYFSLLDTKAAAMHYQRASEKENAPPYLKSLAKRLQTQNDNCRSMQQNLSNVIDDTKDATQKALIKENAIEILVQCTSHEIETAARAYFVNTLKHATSPQELIDAGFLSQPILTLSKQCWVISNEKARLEPCHASTNPPSPPQPNPQAPNIQGTTP